MQDVEAGEARDAQVAAFAAPAHDGEPPAILGAARGAPLVPDPRAAHGRADERYERACAHPHATVRRMTLESGLAHERAAFRRCEEMLKHVLGPRRRPR